MSLEQDILDQEFGNKAHSTAIDAEFTQSKPKSKRLIHALIAAGVVITLGAVAFFYEDFGGSVNKVKDAEKKPAITSAAPPAELSPVLPGESEADTGRDDSAHTEGVSAVVQNENLSVDNSVGNETPAPVFDAPVKAVPVINNESKLSDDQDKSNERLAKLEQRYIDLSTAIEALNKKMDALSAAPKHVEVAKPQATRSEDRPRAAGKEEVTKSMKDLRITALLTDGVVFEGDIAVPVGQYSKTLKGKIVSINPDSNIITTDNRIYKVQ